MGVFNVCERQVKLVESSVKLLSVWYQNGFGAFVCIADSLTNGADISPKFSGLA